MVMAHLQESPCLFYPPDIISVTDNNCSYFHLWHESESCSQFRTWRMKDDEETAVWCHYWAPTATQGSFPLGMAGRKHFIMKLILLWGKQQGADSPSKSNKESHSGTSHGTLGPNVTIQTESVGHVCYSAAVRSKLSPSMIKLMNTVH